MKGEKIYILGGGIAGLIWAYYNEGIVISPEFGGQMNNHFPLGPRFLHKNQYSISFLQSLNLPVKTIQIKTKYMMDDKIFDEIPSEDFKIQYYKKSRGRNDLLGYDATALSSGKNSFEALEVDFQSIIQILIDKLQSENRLITNRILKIYYDLNLIECENGDVYGYDKLINTMPLNIFSKIIQNFNMPKSENFKCEAVTYVWLKNDMKLNYNCNYVYVADDKYKHHRMTFDNKGIIVEWIGHHTPGEIKAYYGESFVECQTLWNAQIIPIDIDFDAPDIHFIGRYGTWNRTWKTEKVIEEAMKWKK